MQSIIYSYHPEYMICITTMNPRIVLYWYHTILLNKVVKLCLFSILRYIKQQVLLTTSVENIRPAVIITHDFELKASKLKFLKVTICLLASWVGWMSWDYVPWKQFYSYYIIYYSLWWFVIDIYDYIEWYENQRYCEKTILNR